MQTDQLSQLFSTKIGGKYSIIPGKQFGAGSFGVVYVGVDEQTDECVAVKLEDIKSSHQTVPFEAKVLKLLQGKTGFPKIYYSGEMENFNIMAIDILGPSLEDLFNICDRKLSLKTVIMIADQLLSRLETFHSKGFIHRDIKPENLLIGLGKKSNILHLIDYGLSKKYWEQRTGQHIPYRENKGLIGTPRYASLYSHLGMEQSRRDDLESIGYIFVYLLKGFLPWQGIKAGDRVEKQSKIMEKKMQTPAEVLCKGLPIQFSVYFNYVKALKFEDKPDYLYLRKMFYDLFLKKNYKLDYMFEWCLDPRLNDPDADNIRKSTNEKSVKIIIDTTLVNENGEEDEKVLQCNDIDDNKNINEDMLESQYNRNSERNEPKSPPQEEILEQKDEGNDDLKDEEQQNNENENNNKEEQSQKQGTTKTKKSTKSQKTQKQNQSEKQLDSNANQKEKGQESPNSMEQNQEQPEKSLFD